MIRSSGKGLPSSRRTSAFVHCLPRTVDADVPTIMAVTGFMFCSSMMLITNKLAVSYMPAPSFVLWCQLVASAGFVWSMGLIGAIHVDVLEWEKVRRFLPVPALFVGLLYCNIKTLQHANVETFIVFRSTTPIALSIADYAFLGRNLPTPRSVASLTGIFVLTGLYVASDPTFHVLAGKWLAAWYIVFLIDHIYTKHVVDTVQMGTWGRVYYCNLFASFPLLFIGVFTHESHDVVWTTESTLALSFSCIVGIGISYFAFKVRALLSATSFSVVGNVCKVATILINYLMWDKHATPTGILFLFGCLISAYFYQQASLRSSCSAQVVENQGTSFAMKPWRRMPLLKKCILSGFILGCTVAIILVPSYENDRKNDRVCKCGVQQGANPATSPCPIGSYKVVKGGTTSNTDCFPLPTPLHVPGRNNTYGSEPSFLSRVVPLSLPCANKQVYSVTLQNMSTPIAPEVQPLTRKCNTSEFLHFPDMRVFKFNNAIQAISNMLAAGIYHNKTVIISASIKEYFLKYYSLEGVKSEFCISDEEPNAPGQPNWTFMDLFTCKPGVAPKNLCNEVLVNFSRLLFSNPLPSLTMHVDKFIRNHLGGPGTYIGLHNRWLEGSCIHRLSNVVPTTVRHSHWGICPFSTRLNAPDPSEAICCPTAAHVEDVIELAGNANVSSRDLLSMPRFLGTDGQQPCIDDGLVRDAGFIKFQHDPIDVQPEGKLMVQIDWQILAHSHMFIGNPASSMTKNINRYREHTVP